MFGLTEVWQRRVRKAGFRASLPTNLPGISFTCRGQIWFRQVANLPTPAKILMVRESRPVALCAVFALASSVAEEFPPQETFAAEQAISATLAKWLPIESRPSLEVKANVSLTLLADDVAKAERFSEARRAARLEEALVRDRMSFLRDIALKDENTARQWWLHLNLAGTEAATSWDDFDKFVRPLISYSDASDDPMTRFTSIMLTLTNRVHESPGLLDALSRVAVASLKIMDQVDLADEIASLTQSARSTPHSRNGFAQG